MSDTRTTSSQPKRTWTSVGGRPVLVSNVLLVVLLVGGALASLVPLLWMFLGSFKTPTYLAQRPLTFLPESWALSNYVEALGRFNFLQ